MATGPVPAAGGPPGPSAAGAGVPPTTTVNEHMKEVADAEPAICHVSTLSFFVVGERPDARTPARQQAIVAAATPFRSSGGGFAAAAAVLPGTPWRRGGAGGGTGSNVPLSSGGGENRKPPPDLQTVFEMAAYNGRSLLSLAMEVQLRSACQDKLRRTSALHLDMSVRRDQVLGVFPEKIFIGTHRYYLTRVVGDYYILDTFVHESDIEERFEYCPPVNPLDGKRPSRDHIPTLDKSYATLFSSANTGELGPAALSVFDYCCLVTLDGDPLPLHRYRLPPFLESKTIGCGHVKPSAAVQPMDIIDLCGSVESYEHNSSFATSGGRVDALDAKSLLAQQQMMKGLNAAPQSSSSSFLMSSSYSHQSVQ